MQKNFALENTEFFQFAGYVSAQLTQIYRTEKIKAIKKNHKDLELFGDAYWKKLVSNIHWNPPVDNINIAPKIFAASKINLNISSAQLETAVNLRVFDVPACGGFLLNDWKEDLANLFDEQNELVIYHSKEELLDKIDFFDRNKNKAESIILNAKNRIIKEHLLEHRIQKLLTITKKVFG